VKQLKLNPNNTLIMNTKFKTSMAIAAATVGFALSANASVSVSSTAPTVDGADIAQLTTNKTWSKSFNSGSGNVGQSFSTGSDVGGYTLNAFSFQLKSASAGVGGTTPASFTVRVIEITGADNTNPAAYTTVATDTGHTFVGSVAVDDWMTWTLNTPLALDPNKIYGVDITVADGGDASFINAVRVGDGTFAGGRIYLGSGALNLTSGEDAVFHADLTTTGGGGNDFSDWIDDYPAVGDLTGFNDDSDNDGNGNGLENYFGTDPSVFSAGVVSGELLGNTFTFTHPLNDTPAEDISAVYLWSTDLMAFYAHNGDNGAGTTVAFSPGTPSGGMVKVTATITGPVPAKLFVNIEVTQTP
jgi:hypothetical protein